jgi:hypothetical protein
VRSVLIYLDAGYPYALYDQVNGNLLIDSIDLHNEETTPF